MDDDEILHKMSLKAQREAKMQKWQKAKMSMQAQPWKNNA